LLGSAPACDAAAPRKSGAFGAVVLAALAVNSALPQAARAESAPEKGELALRHLHYQDQQKVQVQYPDYDGTEPKTFKRITVDAPSVYLLAPIGSKWSLEASAVKDDVSGATPRYYTDVSGATPKPGMQDERKAGDLKLSRHFDRAGISLGASHSNEHDYRSDAISLEGRLSSADNNTTAVFGLGRANDTINPVNLRVVNAKKRTRDYLFGVTHALSSRDLVQLNYTFSDGKGYFTDPYKRNDNRPDARQQRALLARWNHHFESTGSSWRNSYRYFSDSFGIRSHTFETAWVQPLARWFTLTPSLRYYTQSAASFYYDPILDATIYPRPLVPQTYSTADQRMAAFGAVTAGLKAEITYKDWSFDAGYDYYESRSRWRLGGSGSPNLDVFNWFAVQVGASYRF
jgi:hypothetical protein